MNVAAPFPTPGALGRRGNSSLGSVLPRHDRPSYLARSLFLSVPLVVGCSLLFLQLVVLLTPEMEPTRRIEFRHPPAFIALPPPPRPGSKRVVIAEPDALDDGQLAVTDEEIVYEDLDEAVLSDGAGDAGEDAVGPFAGEGTATAPGGDGSDADAFVYADEYPVLITRVTPEFPELARQLHIEGVINVRARIGVDGRVEVVHILDAHPLLEEAAREAVLRWVFTPAISNHRPVAVWVSVKIHFRLR